MFETRLVLSANLQNSLSAMMIEQYSYFHLDANPKFLYEDLDVQEIVWTEEDDLKDQSHGNLKREERKATKRKGENPALLGHEKRFKNEIDSLSDEVLLKIFNYLDRRSVSRCVQVCHRWRGIGYDPSLWHTVKIDNKKLLGGRSLEFILKHRVSFLKMRHCQVLEPVGVSCLKKRKSFHYARQSRRSGLKSKVRNDNFFLQYLDAPVCMFGEGVLHSILKRCRNLKFLSLEGVELSDQVLGDISTNADLKEVNLAMCKGITSNGISKLSKGCQNLVSLNLSWTELCKDTLLKIVNGFPLLEEINLSGNKLGIDNEVVQALVASCPHLKAVDLSDCPMIGDDSIDALVKQTSLKRVSLSRCNRISASKICDIALIKALEQLELFGFANQIALKTIKTVKPSLSINIDIFSPIAKFIRDGIE